MTNKYLTLLKKSIKLKKNGRKTSTGQQCILIYNKIIHLKKYTVIIEHFL